MGIQGTNGDTKIHLDGYCHKSYEPVKNQLEKMLHEGKEENVQLCVYVNQNCVIDLYGTAIGNKWYNAETIQTIMSSGKCIESIIMGMLYGKGLFKYEDKVSQYWPEFAQNGKTNVKIQDVLRHRSGLAWFAETIPTVKNIWTENLKENKVGELIERQTLHFPDVNGIKNNDEISEYHGQTRGLILNEIVRRLDPKGRTMGEILQEDINIDGIYLGDSNDTETTVPVPQTVISNSFILSQTLTPAWMGKKIETMEVGFFNLLTFIHNFFTSKKANEEQIPLFSELKGTEGYTTIVTQEFIDVYNSPDVTKAELPSSNIRANARGLAKLASIMANKGQGIMSQEAWHEMHSQPQFHYMGTSNALFLTNFTKGGVNYFDNPSTISDFDKRNKINRNREGYFGWFGAGGSIMQWHSGLRIGFAFIPTFLNTIESFNSRGAILQGLVKKCAINDASTKNNNEDE